MVQIEPEGQAELSGFAVFLVEFVIQIQSKTLWITSLDIWISR